MKKMTKKSEQEFCAVKTENGSWREEVCLKKAIHMLILYLKTIEIPPDREIIVAGGRGIKEKKDFHSLHLLADALEGGVGASRPLIDEGWFPGEMQMGINGRRVEPGLYIAVGISGAFQHLAAVREAEYVIVINTDRNAPFFERADFGIAGDYREILPLLLYEIRSSYIFSEKNTREGYGNSVGNGLEVTGFERNWKSPFAGEFVR